MARCVLVRAAPSPRGGAATTKRLATKCRDRFEEVYNLLSRPAVLNTSEEVGVPLGRLLQKADADLLAQHHIARFVSPDEEAVRPSRGWAVPFSVMKETLVHGIGRDGVSEHPFVPPGQMHPAERTVGGFRLGATRADRKVFRRKIATAVEAQPAGP